MIHLHPLFSTCFPCHQIQNDGRMNQPAENEYLLRFNDGQEALFPAIILHGLEVLLVDDGAAPASIKHSNCCQKAILPPEVLKGTIKLADYAEAVNLKGFEFFKGINDSGMKEKAARIIEIHTCDLPSFQLVLGIAQDKKALFELVEPEVRLHPFIYEQLTLLLGFFCPGDAKELLGLIREELEVITRKEAQQVLESYNKPIKNDAPFLVQAADQTMQAPLCFKDKNELDVFYDKFVEANHAYLKNKRKLLKRERMLASMPRGEDQFLKSEVHYFKTQDAALKKNLESFRTALNWEFDENDDPIQDLFYGKI